MMDFRALSTGLTIHNKAVLPDRFEAFVTGTGLTLVKNPTTQAVEVLWGGVAVPFEEFVLKYAPSYAGVLVGADTVQAGIGNAARQTFDTVMKATAKKFDPLAPLGKE